MVKCTFDKSRFGVQIAEESMVNLSNNIQGNWPCSPWYFIVVFRV